MGLFSSVKANKAYRLQQKGEKDEAIRLYEEAFSEGVNDSRYNLAYALLIIRDGQYQKAKDFLVKHQKTPMSQEQRTTLLVDYAACCFRLGDLDKGINVLEQQFRKAPSGLLYQTLGYLYVEKYDQANRPDFAAMTAEGAEKAETAGEKAGESVESVTSAADEASENTEDTAIAVGEAGDGKAKTPEEAWEDGKAEAEKFLRDSVDYDEEDPVCLDNLGQFIYRALDKPEEARQWFEKAHALKDSQIDTLYFLSRYDEADGNRKAALEKLEKALEGRFSPLNYCDRADIEREIARLKGE